MLNSCIQFQIWSATEKDQYLTATNLYLNAEEVYSQLTKAKDAYSQKIITSMPLLFRQWSTIMQFPPKILAGSKAHLLKIGLPHQVCFKPCFSPEN